MRTPIVGEPEKVPLNICRDALRYYAKRLLTPRLYTLIHVKLIFDDELPYRFKGNCARIDKYKYEIRVHPKFGFRLMLLTLAHEMVHVCQWARGQMRDLPKARCRYKGRIYQDHDDLYHYWSNPWEIEAYGREIGLYKTFWVDNREKYGNRIQRKRTRNRRSH